MGLPNDCDKAGGRDPVPLRRKGRIETAAGLTTRSLARSSQAQTGCRRVKAPLLCWKKHQRFWTEWRRWALKWTQLALGPIETNGYILESETKEAVIFDPGDEGEKIIRFIRERRLKPLAILLTHAHFDHIGAVDVVRDHFRVPVYLHQKEADWLWDPDKNASSGFPLIAPVKTRPADHLLAGEAPLNLGPFAFQVLETPGHSPGSVSYYLKEAGAVFSGDALFYGSIGRTDLYGGDQALLLESIRTKLFALPDDTVVLPGHGLTTTIRHEKATNPFLT